MNQQDLPLSDEINWGEGGKWEKQYIKSRLSSLKELVSEGESIASIIDNDLHSLPLIDLGCGIGAHLSVFAKKGFDSTGLDISRFALKEAKEISLMHGTDISLSHTNFLELDFFEEIGVITCLNNTIGILSDYNANKLISKISSALVPGGVLIISSDNRERIIEDIRYKPTGVKKWEEKDGLLYRTDISFDFLNGRHNTCSEYMDLKSSEKYSDPCHSIRLFSLSEINKILNDYGLVIEDVMGDYEGNCYSGASPKMIIKARKES